MKKVMRPRYYCDYCKKSGGSSYHMKKHEQGCTLNPNRDCQMCTLAGLPKPDLQSLMEILPTVQEQKKKEYECVYFANIDEGIQDELMRAANYCPACIMAALRLRGLPVPTASKFDYKAACREFWNNHNDAMLEAGVY